MKAVIIVFSPSGHTLIAAYMIQKKIKDKGGTAGIINITKNGSRLFASKSERQKILEDRVQKFDALFAGSPVYAGHAESRILSILESLSLPDQQCSKITIPFITYGGAHSFIALKEMGRALKKKKYVLLLGIKLASLHTLSRFFHKDSSTSFAYTKDPMRFILKLLSQKKIHGEFKTLSIIRKNCSACKKYISVYPINNFIFTDGRVSIKNQKNCILCGECFYNCSCNAIDFFEKIL